MNERTEVIVTSDASGLQWNVCMWDAQTGTSLMTYKGGGVTSRNCLSFLGNDYLLCAEKSRPLLHVWAVNSQEISQNIKRLVAPGCVSALAVSPTNCYCVLAILEKLYIWEVMSGLLSPPIIRHYRNISCIKFTDDGSHFATSGQDGMVIVWPLSYLVAHQAKDFFNQVNACQPEPRYIFRDHTLPVTDILIGHGGMYSLLISVSGDHTCKIYNLADGKLLTSLLFDTALTALTMSPDELDVFIGSVKGNIYQFSISTPPRSIDYHLSKDDLAVQFNGHTKSVLCLSTSLDGRKLLSGSSDEKVIVWDIISKQCLKIILHKGPINNAFFTLCPRNVFLENFKPGIALQSFNKKDSEEYSITVYTKDELLMLPKTSMITHSENRDLEEEIITLKKVNKELYTYSMQKIFSHLN